MFRITKKHKYIPHSNQFIEDLRIYNTSQVAKALRITRSYWAAITINDTTPGKALIVRIEKLCIQARKVREARVAGKNQ